MVNFDRICLQLKTSRFQDNLDVIFGFHESKHISRGVFKTRGYFKPNLSKKMQYLASPPPHSYIINFSFFKNVIKSESLGVRGYYFQDFHISMTPITGKNFKKIHEVRVTCPGLFNMELPIDAFFPLSNRCCDHCKNVFYSFSQQQLSGKHIPSFKIMQPRVKQINITEENLSQSCILCLLLRRKTLASRSKCIKHFFLLVSSLFA